MPLSGESRRSPSRWSPDHGRRGGGWTVAAALAAALVFGGILAAGAPTQTRPTLVDLPLDLPANSRPMILLPLPRG